MPLYSPPILGLTGGIGAGKSAVAEILADLGCLVVHSDRLGRAALRDPEIIDTLVSWWGADLLDETGEIDRRAVADIVFADALQRRRLEALVHPWIEQRRRDAFADAPPDTPALVIDAPLLLEAGIDEECDAVLFVDADESVRLRRLQADRGWDAEELHRREESQLPLDEKRARADYVVGNNGDLSALRTEVRRILQEVKRAPRR